MHRFKSGAYMTFLATSALVLGVLAAPVLLMGENATRKVSKIWAKISLSVLKLFTGITHQIEGRENIPQAGAIVAANHQSMWETLALYAMLPRPVFIFKKELINVPIYGWYVARSGNIAVDRSGGARALRAMQRKAAERIAEDCQIVVFPEGTRLQPGTTANFQPGVAGIYLKGNAPCVPVAHNSGEFWRYPGSEKIAGEITVKFLVPITPGLDRKSFLARLHNSIIEARPDMSARSTDA